MSKRGDTNEVFAKRLKVLRKTKNMTQKDLANALGVSMGSIGFYENQERTPDIDFLKSVSEYFDISADYLLGLQDFPKNPPIGSGAAITYASDITGLPSNLIIALNSMKDISSFCISRFTSNYILIDIGKRVLNVETDA